MADLSEIDKLAFDHAWRWFALHSGQRMQLLNFYFVSLALLLAAYSTALQAKRDVVAGGVALGGVLIVLGCYRLDWRTRQLIVVSEAALNIFETRLASSVGIGEVKLIEAAGHNRARLGSYRTIIQLIMYSSICGFGVAALYAFFR
jgi:hypothetical protein